LIVALAFGCGSKTGLDEGSPFEGPTIEDPAVAVTVELGHTCVLSGDGTAYCWGRNVGNLGDGTTIQRTSPVRAMITEPLMSIDAGAVHTCGVASSGSLYCWGWNSDGQLGMEPSASGHYRLVPTPVDALGPSSVIAVGAGEISTCAIDSEGTVWCWGTNEHGQLGDGTTESRPWPAPVPMLAPAVSVDTNGYPPSGRTDGGGHTCAVLEDGRVMCWGSNANGELGDGTLEPRLSPVEVATITEAVQVSAGIASTCVTTQRGRVACWGANDTGGLGDGTDVDRLMPVFVHGVRMASAVAAGPTSCAVTEDGLLCWGMNHVGQLGDGTRTQRLRAIRVAGIPAAAEVAVDNTRTCAACVDGSAWCWGADANSLGDGVTMTSNTPVRVHGF
jgi:alpha-tubulin suppressor-like RCC1 family protein